MFKVIFKNRKIKKEVLRWLQCRYWNLSDFARFLEERGIETPAYIGEYQYISNEMKVWANDGRCYFVKLQDAGAHGNEYSEIWIQKGDIIYKYCMEYSSRTSEAGKIFCNGAKRVESYCEKIKCTYELYYENRKILRILLYNQSDLVQKADLIEKCRRIFLEDTCYRWCNSFI